MYVHDGLWLHHSPFSYRLCKLCACHVSLFGVSRGVLPSYRLHFRLNSRDYIRVRASPENSGNSFALTSIRIAPPSEAFGSQSKQTDISVIVRRSTASTHAQNKIDPKMGHAFEGPKLVRSLRFAYLATRSILTLAEGYRHHFSMPKSNLGFRNCRVVAQSPRNLGEKVSILSS